MRQHRVVVVRGRSREQWVVDDRHPDFPYGLYREPAKENQQGNSTDAPAG
jgi:hypothetical protein